MGTGLYKNLVELFADDDEEFMTKLDADPEKVNKAFTSWRVREYITMNWLYNDLNNEKYKEVIFSSKRGGTLLNNLHDCEFVEYEAGSHKWPSASINEVGKKSDVWILLLNK